eukprot:7290238-Karenia_brevis.AAC.1
MWTNVGKNKAFSNTTQQCTDAEVADLIKDMIKGSETSAWMMFKDVPKKKQCSLQIRWTPQRSSRVEG